MRTRLIADNAGQPVNRRYSHDFCGNHRLLRELA